MVNHKKTLRIVIIGAGNVATHMASRFFEKGFIIQQVVGRSKKNTELLAKKVNAKAVIKFSDIDTTADVYIIAVNDDAIQTVAAKLNARNKVVVHTSGSVNAVVLKSATKNYGVVYPLQTFSKNKKINFSDVPVCIEAVNKSTEKIIMQLAEALSEKVYKINSEQRKTIHLAAVFACNFTNQMYKIANNMLLKKAIPFEVLKPLIAETAEKIKVQRPADAQTGPAARGDKKTMKEHLKMLSKDKSLKKVYELMSEQIIRSKK
jgi:predicted short-subunit dehydrogenase-like oxidoreductase (DUF2520 family)